MQTQIIFYYVNKMNKTITKNELINAHLPYFSELIQKEISPHTLPKIDIAVIGDQNIGKSSLIKFWLSLGHNTITDSNIYSKIFWFDNNEPLQINIYKISNNNYDNNDLENKKYCAIVYVYSNSLFDSVSEWLYKTKKYVNNDTYQCIILLTSSESDEDFYDHLAPKFFDHNEIEHFVISPKSNTKILHVLNKITVEACKVGKKLRSTNNYGNGINITKISDKSFIEKDSNTLFYEKDCNQKIFSNQHFYLLSKYSPVIFEKNESLEDKFVFIENNNKKKSRDDCVLL
jgi:hypothetical protein